MRTMLTVSDGFWETRTLSLYPLSALPVLNSGSLGHCFFVTLCPQSNSSGQQVSTAYAFRATRQACGLQKASRAHTAFRATRLASAASPLNTSRRRTTHCVVIILVCVWPNRISDRIVVRTVDQRRRRVVVANQGETRAFTHAN